MSKMKKGASHSDLVGHVKPRTSAYKQHGARHGMSTTRSTHSMPHASTYMKKGRVDASNSTTGNRT